MPHAGERSIRTNSESFNIQLGAYLILLYSGLNQERVNSPLDTMRDRRDQIGSVQSEP